MSSDQANQNEKEPEIFPQLDAVQMDTQSEEIVELENPTKINWEDFWNSEKREQAIQTFCNQMHSKSYAILTLPDRMAQIFHETHKVQKEFFSLEENEKQKVAITIGRDVGYKNIPDVKEFFQMRRSNVSNFPWPKNPVNFQKVVSEVWNLQEQMGRSLIEFLAIGLEVDPQKLLVFLDQEKLSNEEFSHSIMGLYHYYDHPTPIETCAIHEDMGLISFIPKSEVSGLQVFDFELWKWVNVEKMASVKDVIVIGCVTLERIAGCYYPACTHRVVNSKDRYSIVFKLRARNDAVIDCVGLQSPKLKEHLPSSFKKLCTVREFVEDTLNKITSVNFPGNSFDNYKQCILNPNINNSFVC